MSRASQVANPCLDTLNVYDAGGNAAKLKNPSALLTAVRSSPLAWLRRIIAAPETYAPEVSNTVPSRLAALDCAFAVGPVRTNTATSAMTAQTDSKTFCVVSLCLHNFIWCLLNQR